MERLTVESVLELIATQSKQFLDNLDKSIEKSRREFDEALQKERLEREESLKKERLEREKSRQEFEESLKKERLEREKSRQEFEESLKKEHLERQKSNKEAADRLRKLEGNWGQFVESLVRPGLIELFNKHEIGLRAIYPNVTEFKDSQKLYEIDLFAIDDIYAVAVEVKTSLVAADVDEHLARLKKIQEQPPHDFNLKGKTILGAIAGITVKSDSDKYAQRKGLFVLTQKGNLLEMLSPAHPKEWKIT